MGLYRQSSGPKSSGLGVSGDGYDGAESFFEQTKTLAGELNLPFVPNAAEESAAAKAAVDAYMGARNGHLSPTDAFFNHGKVEPTLPDVDIETETHSDLNIGNNVEQFIDKLGEVLTEAISSPLGFLSSILNFLFKLLTEVATGITQVVMETARAAAAALEDTLKKQSENISQLNSTNGLQPLELYNQSASTNILAHSLNNNN